MRDFASLIVFAITTPLGLSGCQDAHAIPSPLPHQHDNWTVDWKDPRSPPLPWTDAVANRWNHNHLTADPFDSPPRFVINKAWDNHTLHSSLEPSFQSQFGHGLISPGNQVRYGFAANVPDIAKNIVEAAFDDWISAATAQFNLHRKPQDRLGIGFTRADRGPFDITVNFDPNLDAYGSTEGTTITFLSRPDPTFTFAALDEIFGLSIANPAGWRMSFDNGISWKNVLEYSAPWSYDGTPDVVRRGQNIDFMSPDGITFDSIGGLDTLNLTEMDFRTIATHEIGHVIGLGHPGDNKYSIMRTNIYRNAIFGSAMAIDAGSALGVAIDYTYIHEPSTMGLLVSGFMAFIGTRRNKESGARA
jgi:hypothetical protein